MHVLLPSWHAVWRSVRAFTRRRGRSSPALPFSRLLGFRAPGTITRRAGRPPWQARDSRRQPLLQACTLQQAAACTAEQEDTGI